MISALKKYWIYFIPFLINSAFIWYLSRVTQGSFFQYIDGSFFITSAESIRKFGHTWETFNLGNSSLNEIVNLYPRLFSTLFYTYSDKTKVAQLIYYGFSFNLVVYSAWYFFTKTLKKIDERGTLLWATLVAALFYTYNVFFSLLWTGGVGDQAVLFLSSMPIFLYFATQVLVDGKLTWSDSLIIALLVGINMNTIPFNIALWLVLLLGVIFAQIIFDKKFFSRTIILKLIFALIISLGVGAVFLLPLYILYSNPDPFFVGHVSSGYIFTSHGIAGILQFFYIWSINITRNGWYAFVQYQYFIQPVVIFLTFIFWAHLLLDILKTKSKKQKKFSVFLWFVIIFSLFAAKGIQPPLSFLNQFLYDNVPLWSLFRTPDSKFGMPLILILSFSISTLLRSSGRYSRIILTTFVIVQILPFFSASAFLGTPAGSKTFTMPHDYIEVSTHINKTPGDGSVLFVPGNEIARYVDNPYNQDILGKMLTKNPIYWLDTRIMTRSKERILSLLQNIQSENPGKTRIQHIIVRNDIIWNISSIQICDYSERYAITRFESVVDTSPYLEKTLSIDRFSVYTLKHSDLLSSKWSIDSSSSEIQVISEKKSREQYSVVLRNPTNDPISVSLLLRESYHPLWKIQVDNSPEAIAHNLYDGYANEWKLSIPAHSQKQVRVQFQLQMYYRLAILVSIFSSMLVVSTAAIIFFHSRYSS